MRNQDTVKKNWCKKRRADQPKNQRKQKSMWMRRGERKKII